MQRSGDTRKGGKMTIVGFCDGCGIRIFKDEVLGKDYYKEGENLVCEDCAEYMMGIHKEDDRNGLQRKVSLGQR